MTAAPLLTTDVWDLAVENERGAFLFEGGESQLASRSFDTGARIAANTIRPLLFISSERIVAEFADRTVDGVDVSVMSYSADPQDFYSIPFETVVVMVWDEEEQPTVNGLRRLREVLANATHAVATLPRSRKPLARVASESLYDVPASARPLALAV